MQSILLTNGFWRWVAAGQRGRKAQSLNCWSSQMWLRATLCSGCQPGAVLEAGQPRVWPRPAAARGEVSWDFVQTNSEKDFRGLIPPLSSLDGLLHGSTVLLHEKPSYLHLPRCISGCCSLLLEVCVLSLPLKDSTFSNCCSQSWSSSWAVPVAEPFTSPCSAVGCRGCGCCSHYPAVSVLCSALKQEFQQRPGSDATCCAGNKGSVCAGIQLASERAFSK